MLTFYCEHDLVRSECGKCNVIKSAVLSDDRLYRYVLWRKWDESLPFVMFIGLNPSIANEAVDDPTTRRCISFAKSWGFGAVAMVNLFAWRSTQPTGLLNIDDPVGPDNDAYLQTTGRAASLVIAAWGNGSIVKAIDPERPVRVARMFNNVCALTINNDGQPGHALYLKGDVTPTFWTPGILELKNAGKKSDNNNIWRRWPGE